MYFFNVALIALLAVIASASAIPHSRMTEADITHCQRGCPDIYLPVCGYNNEEYKVFDNDCNMEVENCIQQVRHNAVFMETSITLCEKQTESMLFNDDKKTDCNKICTMGHNPICGSDGHESKTYDNMCTFEVANCEANYKLRVVRMGECLEINPLKNDCNKSCAMEVNPICGSDGHQSKTYDNMCSYEVANCEANYKLRVARMGECLEINPLKNDCYKACAMEFDPICSSDDHESKTYDNMCSYEIANCEANYKLRVAGMGDCLEISTSNNDCNKACTMEFNPICGSDDHDSKTYDNMCAFEVANCEANYKLRVALMGECLEISTSKNDCNKACTMEFNPICGSDDHESKTYDNMCAFEVANCLANYTLRVARMGECLDSNPLKYDCNKACSMEYNPICGSDDHESTTYGNMCIFELANCLANYTLQVARMGKCLESNTLKNDCNKACTMEFNPICGSDGHESKTYDNMCAFEVANCEANYKLRVASRGECLEINQLKNNCNKACTMEYNPVCASDGNGNKTYGNMCTFEVANCEANYKLQVARMGECLEINPLKNDCHKACTMEFNPICSSDGHENKTWGNMCTFEVANCLANYKLRVARMGECLEINPLKNDCNKTCGMEFIPICGSDDHESKTYDNMCTFEVANCEANYKLRVARMGECLEINLLKNDCNKACTMEFNPICGSDGHESKTYGNMCIFEVANCLANYTLRVARMGECLEISTSKNDCYKVCTMEYKPICGSDGHESTTYGNMCIFELANCLANYTLRVARMGKCLESNTLKNDCNKACTMEFNPICGSDDHESKTYDNMCLFEVANCEANYKLQVASMGECLDSNPLKYDCNKACSMEYNPICGSDGHESKTYDNMCAFEVANCEANYKLRVASRGECLEINPLKNNCNKACTMEYNPICGSDGNGNKTYDNMCTFEVANCEANYKLRVARMGECLDIIPVKNDCHKACTMEFNPICSSDGHENKTWGNMCTFEVANCLANYKLRVARIGECLEINPLKNDCNKACTMEYNPICGSDDHESKTYDNMCTFEVANCEANYTLRVARMGECLEINPLKNDCNKACTMEFNPICSSDGHENKTYGNMCIFEVANCLANYTLRVARMGECLEINTSKYDCFKACTMELNPICGSDDHESKTYGNMCIFEVANCLANYTLRVARMGECLEIIPLKNDCNKPCTMEFCPICGSDGHKSKTYDNMCAFEVANCEANYKLRVVRMGECLEIKNDCHKACTMEFNPICSSDGHENKTYGNMCIFQVANCLANYKLQVPRIGECLEITPLKNDCNNACTMEYNPICGTDGHGSKTYGNMCSFEVANCEANYKLRVARMGKCLEIKNDCHKACTMEFNPICSTDGHENKTWGNMCTFEVANCLANYKLRVARIGKCLEITPVKNDCNKACTMEYNPICGTDGHENKTYGNMCSFEVANCLANYTLRVARMGECLEIKPLKNDCNKACTREYDPICGTDGHKSKTYGNMCSFEVANCESNNKLRVERMGDCQINEILPVMKIKIECIRFCPKTYEPICASDGKNYHIFENTCEFEIFNCTSETPLHVFGC